MTVKELRDQLQFVPQEAVVIIEDADANWWLELKGPDAIRQEDNSVILSADYLPKEY